MRNQLKLDLAACEMVVGLRRFRLRERLARLIFGEFKEFILVVSGNCAEQGHPHSARGLQRSQINGRAPKVDAALRQ